MPFAITLIFIGYVLVYGAVANHGTFATSPWVGLFMDAYDVPIAPPSTSAPGGTNPGSTTTPPGATSNASFNVPSGHWSPADIAAYARSRGAPASVADSLGATSQPESGGDPNAVNKSSGATGLLQILPRAWRALAAAGNLKDGRYNIDAALYVLSVQGSGAWSGSGTWRGPAVPPGRYHFPFPGRTAQPTLRSRVRQTVVGRAA